MEDVFEYLEQLPDGISEAVAPCADGFTVYIDEALDEIGRLEAYNHAIRHIKRRDFAKKDVQMIESATPTAE